MGNINFNKEKYNSLKLLYEQAVISNREQLVFEGHILLTSYTKYLLQHLENVLEIDEKNKKNKEL